MRAKNNPTSGRTSGGAAAILAESCKFMADDYMNSVKDIDDQHDKILDMYGEIVDLIASRSESCPIIGKLREMNVYLSLHFSAEESLMSVMNYPGKMDHTQQHREFRDRFEIFLNKVSRGLEDYVDSIESVGLWLLGHIKTSDHEFAEYCALQP